MFPRWMADCLPGDFLPLTVGARQEPRLLADALGSASPTVPRGSGSDRSLLLLSLFALAGCVLTLLFLSRAAQWAMCNQSAVPTHHLLPFLYEEVKDGLGSFFKTSLACGSYFLCS